GLRIVPVGLTYHRKTRFRSRVLASIGEPFHIGDLRELHESDEFAAVRALTDRIAQRLEQLTLNTAALEDADLIDTAERLYARERGMSRWRERDVLADRLPRMQAFARGLAWLRDNEPDRYERLARAVRHYRRRTRLLGVEDGDVPARFTLAGTLRYVIAQSV